MQPGDTITPGSQPTSPDEPSKVTEVEVSLHQAAQAMPASQAELPAVPEPPAANPEPAAPDPAPPVQEAPLPVPLEQTSEPQPPTPTATEPAWQYQAEDTPAAEPPAAIQPVTWTASEYIAHQKSPAWFVMMTAVIVVVSAVVFLLTRDVIAPVVLAIAGIIFCVFSARAPRVLEYSVNEQGVHIGPRLFPYHDLRSFAVSQEGPLPSILLIPLKRFLPPITVFYEPQSEDAILAVLSSYLPLEQKQPDAVDKLMSKIRF